jgi:hypothetical protein
LIPMMALLNRETLEEILPVPRVPPNGPPCLHFIVPMGKIKKENVMQEVHDWLDLDELLLLMRIGVCCVEFLIFFG